MISYPFTPKQGPIVVEAQATGPRQTGGLRLLLDTAATMSVIKLATLVYIGLDLSQPLRKVSMATGSAVELVPVSALTRLTALGQHRFIFPVIGHTPPAARGVDGLLSLDSLRDQVLNIDFRLGQITLA
jgi:hypothetical protein